MLTFETTPYDIGMVNTFFYLMQEIKCAGFFLGGWGFVDEIYFFNREESFIFVVVKYTKYNPTYIEFFNNTSTLQLEI